MPSLYGRHLRLRKGGWPWIELSAWYWFGRALWEVVRLPWGYYRRFWVCHWPRSYRFVFRPPAVELQTNFVLGAGIGSASPKIIRLSE